MKAVYIEEFGAAENLSIRTVADPSEPHGDEVLVRVRAAALNRADLLQRRGLYPAPAGYPERIPGLEFAGEIAAVGESAGDWAVGDRVFGITAGGAQSELVKTRCGTLMRIPGDLDFVSAASIPEAFITAFDAIDTLARIQPAESLLIHAVGSGVGLAALQIAKSIGATVFGTSRSADKLQRCQRFGLDGGFETADVAAIVEANDGNGIDVVLDLVGAKMFDANLNLLARKGRLILVGLVGGRKAEFDLGIALSKRLSIIGTVLRSRTDDEKAEATRLFAARILPLIESGAIVPNLDRVFPVTEVAAAHRYLEADQSFGKVVLEFD